MQWINENLIGAGVLSLAVMKLQQTGNGSG
jgi:hypothetical protein